MTEKQEASRSFNALVGQYCVDYGQHLRLGKVSALVGRDVFLCDWLSTTGEVKVSFVTPLKEMRDWGFYEKLDDARERYEANKKLREERAAAAAPKKRKR